MSIALTSSSAPPPSTGMVPRDFEQALRLAEMMAQSKLVPAHLHGKPSDCLLVVEQAMRWNMSPFAVAQGTFVTQGKLGYLGTLMHAAVEQNAPIQGHLSYHYHGEGDDRAVTVRGALIGEAEPREVVVALRDVRTGNVWWKKTPDQMLAYHGARVWARRHTPGVIFGAYSREELADALDPDPRFVENAAMAEAPEQPVIDPASLVSASSFGVDCLDNALADLATADDLRGYLGEPRLQSWLAGLRRDRPEQAEQANAIIAAAWVRVRPECREEGTEEVEVEEVAGQWVIVGSAGNTAFAGRDEWLDGWRARVAAIEAAPRSVTGRRAVLERMLALNSEVFRHLQRTGCGSAVLEAQGISAAADGRLANADAKLPAAAG